MRLAVLVTTTASCAYSFFIFSCLYSVLYRAHRVPVRTASGARRGRQVHSPVERHCATCRRGLRYEWMSYNAGSMCAQTFSQMILHLIGLAGKSSLEKIQSIVIGEALKDLYGGTYDNNLHYSRHCLWENTLNKKLSLNHTVYYILRYFKIRNKEVPDWWKCMYWMIVKLIVCFWFDFF